MSVTLFMKVNARKTHTEGKEPYNYYSFVKIDLISVRSKYVYKFTAVNVTLVISLENKVNMCK